jgi:holo-[acyl-carrier protein] synthase
LTLSIKGMRKFTPPEVGTDIGPPHTWEVLNASDAPTAGAPEGPLTWGEVRVGVDVASVSAVARSITQFGDRYLRRLFTPSELDHCAGIVGPIVESLAARFAAKEACIKVLRPGGRQVNWRAMEIRSRPDDSCTIVLTGDAASLAMQAGISGLSVALSHEGDVAVAVVFAHCDTPRSRIPLLAV